LAFRSLIESVRKDASKFNALVYNLPVVNTYSPDYNNIEDSYERIILNEAEKILDKKITDYTDIAITDTVYKFQLSLSPEAKPNNFNKDSTSLTASAYRREHVFNQSEIDDGCSYDRD
jgi:hypothetical protein